MRVRHAFEFEKRSDGVTLESDAFPVRTVCGDVVRRRCGEFVVSEIVDDKQRAGSRSQSREKKYAQVAYLASNDPPAKGNRSASPCTQRS